MVSPQLPGQLAHINSVRHEEKETRRAEAWKLRRDGFTMREIAERLDISPGTVADYLEETLAELKETSRESADSWRQLQLDRLDNVISTWLPVSRDMGHLEATRGAAIVVRAVEAQSRLLGLLQPHLMGASTGQPAESMEELLEKSPALVDAVERQIARAKAVQKTGGPKPAQHSNETPAKS